MNCSRPLTHFDDRAKFEITKLADTVDEKQEMIDFLGFAVVDVEIVKTTSFDDARFQLRGLQHKT